MNMYTGGAVDKTLTNHYRDRGSIPSVVLVNGKPVRDSTGNDC